MTKKERNKLIYLRYEEGYSQVEIGKFYGLSQSQISSIVLKKKQGIGEPTIETRGSKSKLNAEQLIKLKELLSKAPESDEHSYWDKWSVQALIQSTFGVKYHENSIYKILRKIGFSSQLPQKKDYRQSKKSRGI